VRELEAACQGRRGPHALFAEALARSSRPFGAEELDDTIVVVNDGLCDVTGYIHDELHSPAMAACLTMLEWREPKAAALATPRGSGQPQRYDNQYAYLPATISEDSLQQDITSSAPGSRDRVLVMDDEEIVTRTAKRMLQKLGYEVEVAGDGAEAVVLYRQACEQGRPFAAVILDLIVPGGMGGCQTVERLLDLDPGVRAIVSSGYSTDPVMSGFLEYGFVAMIDKPYRLEELQSALETAKVS
jgi:CheY-like chemotaxis protein